MPNILELNFPFFVPVLCDYAVVRRGWLPLDSIPGFNVFVPDFTLRCLLFRFSAATPIARMLDPSVFGFYLECALAMVAIGVGATRRGAALPKGTMRRSARWWPRSRTRVSWACRCWSRC